MGNKENKSQLRKQYRKERADRFIADSWLHILSAKEFENIKNDLNQRLISAGKTVFLPKVIKDNDLAWVKWDGTSANLKKVGKSYEPIGDADINVNLDLIIVPALHVDRAGNRLGQGGGSYDRALAKSKAWTIALLHRGELTSEPLPVEPHDQKVKAAATPEIIVRF